MKKVAITVKSQRWSRPWKDCNDILFVDIWGYINMEKTYKVKNKRLSKYLYSLGFDREYVIDNNMEYWFFEKSKTL